MKEIVHFGVTELASTIFEVLFLWAYEFCVDDQFLQ
jgi:hypothetical protein